MDFDVVVVGGGLLGAGIARDAALRGLSVALFEAADFGAGAVAAGSRLALGGLSALGTLDFTHVREDIREREILLQTAPHLVRPQTCLVPFYNSHGLLAQARLRAGLALSDALGFDHAGRVHQLLPVRDAKKRAPGLRPDGLLGAALVWEAAVPAIERLARELAFDARRHGAVLHPHTRVEELCRDVVRQGRERVGGVRWTCALTGETGETDASLVILAAGAGQQTLAAEQQTLAGGQPPLRFVKTVSVVGPALTGSGDVLVLPEDDPPALRMTAPVQIGTWAGSLSTEYHGEVNAAYATGGEVAALAQSLQAALPGFDAAAVLRAQAALHAPVAPGREVADPAANGGRCDGLITASGAGVTRFRQVAEDAVDLACRKLGRALSVPPCRTASTPLPPTASIPTGTQAAVEFAVAEEGCLTLRDFWERRRPSSWSVEERQARQPDVLEALAGMLGWDAARQAAEVKAWDAETALGQAFRVL